MNANDLNTSDDPAADQVSGFSLEELSDYAAKGRIPQREDIEQDLEARRAVTQLQHLRTMVQDVVIADGENYAHQAWFHNVLHNLKREVRQGRTVPISSSAKNVELSVSEGALKALLRAECGAHGSVIIGRITFVGDLTRSGESIGVSIDAAVLPQTRIPDSASQIRAAADEALSKHTTLAIDFIDVNIIDVVYPLGEGEDHG